MRSIWALALAAVAVACAPQYAQPCRVDDDLFIASMPGASIAGSGPAMDVLDQGRVRARWWTAPALLADGGVTDAVAGIATFDADGQEVQRAQVPWPLTSAAAANQLMFSGPPLWVDDGAAQVQAVMTASVDPGGAPTSQRRLRYAHVSLGTDAGVQYDDIPSSECTDCRLDFFAQRTPQRVVSLFTQANLYAAGPEADRLAAQFTSFDGGSAGGAPVPDAGPVWASGASLQGNAQERLVALGPPSAPSVYDETLTRIGGPFPLEGSVSSVLSVSTSAAVASWRLGTGYVLVQGFDLDGSPNTIAIRATSASDVLAVAQSGSLLGTAAWDGQQIWAAVTDVSGNKQGSDLPLGSETPRSAALFPTSGGFRLWVLHGEWLRQVRLTCDWGAAP